MPLNSIIVFALSLVLFPQFASAQQDAGTNNAIAGCVACHAISADSTLMAGPHLLNIVGRDAASVSEFDYSDALKTEGANGFVWTRESLDEFLRQPNDFIEGTSMQYPGELDDQIRSRILDWLESLNATNDAATDSNDFADPRVEEILQLSADPDYGEYLAGECVTCHSDGAASGGVPAIRGQEQRYFILALLAYQDGSRSNTTMQQITKSLGKEEMAALAKYFSIQ